MATQLRTLDYIVTSLKSTRERLEKKKPGCTAHIHTAEQMATEAGMLTEEGEPRPTLDHFLTEDEALNELAAQVDSEAAKPVAAEADNVKLTTTQKVLKAKGLPLTTKVNFSAFVVGLFTLALSAVAQDSGPYSLRSLTGGFVNGGTNAIPVSSTNTLAAIDVSDHDRFGASFSMKAMASATSTVGIYGYKSLGLSKYETNPSLSTSVTLSGTTEVTVFVDDINVRATASYKFVLVNTNASVAVTNLDARVRFKTPGYRDKP